MKKDTIVSVIAIVVIVLILVLLSAVLRRDEPNYAPYSTAAETLTEQPDSMGSKAKVKPKKEKNQEPKRRRRPQQRDFLNEPVPSE